MRRWDALFAGSKRSVTMRGCPASTGSSKTSRGVAHRSNRTKIVAKLRQVERLKDLELENSRPFT